LFVCLFAGVDELASIESSEVVDFRKHMREVCERTARTRDSQVINAVTAAIYYRLPPLLLLLLQHHQSFCLTGKFFQYPGYVCEAIFARGVTAIACMCTYDVSSRRRSACCQTTGFS